MRHAAAAVLVLATGSAQADHGDVGAGKRKALAACASCHGPDGNSKNPEWPKLAGQHAVYLINQLMAFQSGERRNALMSPQARRLSEADMHDLAAYYEAQRQR